MGLTLRKSGLAEFGSCGPRSLHWPHAQEGRQPGRQTDGQTDGQTHLCARARTHAHTHTHTRAHTHTHAAKLSAKTEEMPSAARTPSGPLPWQKQRRVGFWGSFYCAFLGLQFTLVSDF